ncbi:MAG: glutamate--tRNA ligase [Bacteroidetes bacterium CG12_big_fil_rev_8_21_14_0_65_60_17]|nr:MAG: glutamate--tRNA ligase [Bacteroidetes bacterium CG12_big_fil_rev_8_21_14_0_65_60_17]
MRVRFAPSPTGYLHVGGLRTALYNWLLARQSGGTFILRIEDTDRTRFVADAEEDIVDSLEWAGLDVDEGPETGSYRQSERTALYDAALARLLEEGNAYIAFDTPEEIEQMRSRLATDTNPNPRYDWSTRSHMKNSLTLGTDEVALRRERGDPFVVRLRVEPGAEVLFTDIVRGDVRFRTDDVDDQVLMKSDGLPTYHLANVVDDHDMRISHVIRGEEWLSSVPKHVLLYQALGWETPRMAHLPLILSPTGGKLSKRNADKQGIPVFVREYREAGYEPSALLNYLALLGWHPESEQEVFSLEGLVDTFSLDRVGPSGVQFDMDKLAWFNGQHIRMRSPEEIAKSQMEALKKAYGDVDEERAVQAARLMHERMAIASDLVGFEYLFKAPSDWDEAGVRKRWKDDSARLVQTYRDALMDVQEWTAEQLEETLRRVTGQHDVGAGRLIHPVRLAVSGVSHGPGLFDLLVYLGRDAVCERLERAVNALG